ncbi:MAG: ketopantoate reductase family protein [Blastocatellia bacterium]
MSDGKRPRYVIFGAGAVGSTVGGLLARAGSRVVCVARPARVAALSKGIVLKLDGREIVVKVESGSHIRDLKPDSSDIVVITTKSQMTESVIGELAVVYNKELRVVCLQNGTRNEEIARRTFENVYAGLVFFSAVQLEPTSISLPQGLTVAVGCYPKGVDNTARELCDDLTRAGFDTLASGYVMSMKWGKLVANLNNATHAITGYWLERGMADREMRRLMLEVREEGLRVLDAAGIEVEPPAGEPSPIRIREMTEKLRLSPDPQRSRADVPEEHRTYASMWQDLVLNRRTSEVDFLNGEIVRLGRKLGIPTPYNAALLEIVNRMFDGNLKPGIHTPAELRAQIRSSAAGFQH